MIRLENKQPRVIGLSNGVTIMPMQSTDVSAEQFNSMKQERNFGAFLKRGWLLAKTVEVEAAPEAEEGPEKVAAADVDEDEEIDLKTMGLSRAKLLVSATANAELLEKWHEEDKRKGVKKAIEARLAELANGVDDIPEPEESAPFPGIDEIFGEED